MHYFALGDSMSVDCYPFYDLPVHKQSVEHQYIGAASLFYRNDCQIWPEFAGTDLLSSYPNLIYSNLAKDGATTFDLLESDYWEPVMPYRELSCLVTLTIGGNDLLSYFNKATAPSKDFLSKDIKNVLNRYSLVVNKIKETLPSSVVILNTVYDPTDGQGNLPGYSTGNFSNLFVDLLQELNNHIRQVASKTEGSYFCDVYEHFLGHGSYAPPTERWYWPAFPIEPSSRGASEIRRLWLETVRRA